MVLFDSFLILQLLVVFVTFANERYYNTHAFQSILPTVIHHQQHAATRSILFRRKNGHNNINNSRKPFGIRSLSPLNTIFQRIRLQRRNSRGSTSSASSSALNMVFTTPSSIIEQASTKILLDDLIDESVRSIPRTTVMMQFDPSSGWVCLSN